MVARAVVVLDNKEKLVQDVHKDFAPGMKYKTFYNRYTRQLEYKKNNVFTTEEMERLVGKRKPGRNAKAIFIQVEGQPYSIAEAHKEFGNGMIKLDNFRGRVFADTKEFGADYNFSIEEITKHATVILKYKNKHNKVRLLEYFDHTFWKPLGDIRHQPNRLAR